MWESEIMHMMDSLREAIFKQICKEEDKRVFDFIMELANTTEAATQTDRVDERHDEVGSRHIDKCKG